MPDGAELAEAVTARPGDVEAVLAAGRCVAAAPPRPTATAGGNGLT